MRKVIEGGMVRKDGKGAGSNDDHATRKHGRKKHGRGMFGRKG